MKKQYISWEEVKNLVDILHTSILQSGKKFDYICGIPRGGLIPAVMLSHKLNIPYHLDIDSYYVGEDYLYVDDICDSGKTLEDIASDQFKSTAVLHYKPHTSRIKPTFYSSIWGSDTWIVYPWEAKDSKTIQDYKVTNVLGNE